MPPSLFSPDTTLAETLVILSEQHCAGRWASESELSYLTFLSWALRSPATCLMPSAMAWSPVSLAHAQALV